MNMRILKKYLRIKEIAYNRRKPITKHNNNTLLWCKKTKNGQHISMLPVKN